MPVLTCSGCSRLLKVPDRLLGKKTRCPACALVQVVPVANEADQPTVPPAGSPTTLPPPEESATVPPGRDGETVPPPDPEATLAPAAPAPTPEPREGLAPPGYEVLGEL